MARIRTIKPEFFRHEELQDLETANPGKFTMLVFAALWGHCDNQGVFVYRPRQLKLDILPYLNFNMEETLAILEESGFITSFTDDGKDYGHIPTFLNHQNLNGKEATAEGKKHPSPNGTKLVREIPVSSHSIDGAKPCSDSAKPVSQEGKGRERKGKDIAPVSKTDAIDPDKELYQAINQSFLAKNGNKFTNYAKEGEAIKAIITKSKERSEDDPSGFAKSMMEAFWKLKSSGDRFWSGQPFLPSSMNSSGLWDRILETLRAEEPDMEARIEAMADLGLVL